MIVGIVLFLLRIDCLQAQACPQLMVERDAIGPAMTCGVPCQLMELTPADQCRFDVSGCGENVPAGTSCAITCRDPFSGEAALASCPPGNTNPATPVEWSAPACDLFASDCPRLMELPEAYVEAPGGWACAEGFAGDAVARCVPDDECASSLQWFGCEKTAACAPPLELIGCLFNVTQCIEVKPGGSCPVSCRFPYTGWSSVAVCPPDNVDSESGLLVVEPECTLTCEDPPNEPEGYVKANSGNGWACAPGYGGVAEWECVIDSVCESRKVLSGCSLLARCIVPDVENACMYDFTNCIGESASPGRSCQVHCKQPYQGDSTSASCPSGNTNPLRELSWEVPNCQIDCEEVANVPVGYVSHPYLRVFGGWQCTDGYGGVPRVTCTTANCNPLLLFAGCNALIPCDPPVLTRGDLCAFQHTCISVRSGGSCEITCRAPYVGGIALASCPPNNTIVGRQLIMQKPDCNLECPMPDPVPAGYLSNGIDNTGQFAWLCAPFYEGVPIVTCTIGDDCVAAFVFDGCVPQTSCRIPDDVPCSLDFSNCQNVFAGATCEVSCGPSFTGNITEASCPAGNTDPLTPLEWTFPACILTCQDPVDPVGYVKTRFMCAANHSGSPGSRCAADFNDQCNPTYSFFGCNERVPCAPPVVGGGRVRLPSYSQQDELCMFDFSDCQRVMPGGNCTIRCGMDYEGKSTMAYCPSDNTDPNGQLVYLEPKCSLKACEMRVPPGYVETPCGWVCDTGYIGNVDWHCAAVGTEPGRCRSELVIGGCTLTVQCAPLMVNDTCRTNASQCMALQPGQGCNITCAEPYTGGQGENATWAYCPGSTTTLGQQPVWATALEEWALDCDIDCEMPDPIPAGYLLQGGVWSCDTANQYSGQALGECLVNDTNCEPNFVLSGCFPTTPCDFPAIDSCQHDVSACPSNGQLLSGTSCEVKCKAPYLTPLGEAHGSIECRDPNIDPQGAIWKPPSCILGCAEPSSQTGYQNVVGEWQCADGYSGPGAIWSECVVDPASCVAFPRLFGCQPFVKCANPVLTAEQQCTIDLTGGSCLDLQPGEVCTVYCQGPNYFGDQLGAGCPATNLDPNKVINWAAPSCFCREPVPPPAGYLLGGTPNTYRCAPGYYGQANYRCQVDTTTCEPIITLTGCSLLASCAKPQVDDYDRCKLDFTECEGPIPPGESCNVTCNPGFNVNLSNPECPADNTVTGFQPLLDIYCGEYTCAPPDVWAASNPLPKGYDVGTWRCTSGFRGSVSTRCVQSDECGGTLQLSGCVPLQPCSVPRLTGRDLCRWNFSECEDTFSGTFCGFSCASPFSGPGGQAFCPPDNVDPATELVFVQPECSLECPDPNPVPPGYLKLDCGWTCAPGYDGRPRAECDVDDQCQPQLTLRGCEREEKCVLPPVGSYDICRFDFSGCAAETEVGSSCTVKCKAPFSGEDFQAVCPSGNTIPQFPLVFNQELCNLTCPTPDPIPGGYMKVNETWRCSEGYVGLADSSCVQRDGCGEPQLLLKGCDENVPCAPPGSLDRCKFQTTCGPSVGPGESCSISCKAPFEGNESTSATCPNPNTQRGGPSTWEAPECSLLCPEMDMASVPTNYTFEGSQLVCADGAIGMAMVECRVDPQTCGAFWYFSGCLMLQRCLVPMVDSCRIDVGNCTEVYPGEFCIMSCQGDFLGGETIGRCPPENTNAGQQIQFNQTLACNCPAPPAQAGYQLVSSSGDGGEWTCRDGWTGQAAVACNVDAQTCQREVQLSGCVALRSCAPPEARYWSHPEDCQRISAGESCEARCAASECLAGGPVMFTCPADNVDITQPAVWASGACRVRCEVCRTTPFVDTDARPNWMGGSLQFGEAHANGLMPVQAIEGYRVFFANDCGEQVGPTLGYVPRSDALYSCCAATAYSVTVGPLEIPADAVEFRIAINSSLGELPFAVAVVYSDRTETEVMSTLKPITAFGSTRKLGLAMGLWLTMSW